MSGHWYCVDKIGMATLCLDEADAKNAVVDYSLVYPKLTPYTAVQLADPYPLLARIKELETALKAAIPHLPKSSLADGGAARHSAAVAAADIVRSALKGAK